MKKYAILVYIGILCVFWAAFAALDGQASYGVLGEFPRRIELQIEKRWFNMAKDINLQDVFLNQARKDKIPVTIYITNGFQFKGVVRASITIR